MGNLYSEDINDAFYIGDAFQLFFKGSAQSLVIKANPPYFTIMALSDNFIELSLRKRSELLGKNLLDVFPDHFEYDSSANGVAGLRSLYWSSSYQAVPTKQGETAYIIMTISATEGPALQQERLNKMFLKAPIGMSLFSKGNFIIEYANEAICKMWNEGPPEKVVGKSVFDLIPSLERTGLRKVYNQVIETGITYIDKECPVTYDRNGQSETYYFDLHFEPVYGSNKEITGMLALTNEVTEQVLNRKTIENAEERLRLASDATGIGNWDLDLQTKEIIYSARLADLFGYPGKKDLKHHEMRALVHPNDKTLVEQAFDVALITGKYFYQARIIRPDQLVHWISVTGKVLFREDGVPLRMLGTVMDITESKHEEIQKNDFIAIASHELKTPLTSLKAYAQFLKTGKNAAEPGFVASVADRIEGQINKMTKLVYSFLDLSRIESGKTEMIMEMIDINEIIVEVAGDYVMRERDHPIFFEPVTVPAVYADRNKISQVVDNLISNAIKYSPQGGTINLSAAVEDDHVLVSVVDHGIGIDNNHIVRIFDRFYRIDDLQVKNASGFGIGLYLCADIIKRHNGRIGLQSEPGKGSNFYFALPVKPL